MASAAFDAGQTSIHVRRAIAGDLAGVAWLVERFTPALLLLSERRLGRLVLAAASPDDIVQHVWLTALRRLPEFQVDGGYAAPRLVKFLTTILLRHVRDLSARELRRGAGQSVPEGDPEASAAPGGVSALADSLCGPLTGALQGERQGALRAAIAALDPADREIVVRRAFEDESCDDIGADLGMASNTVAQRYRRALAKLRESLPASVFDEFEDA